MISAVLLLLFVVALVTAYTKVKNDRALDVAESDLDEDLDQNLVDEALSPPGQDWDAAQ